MSPPKLSLRPCCFCAEEIPDGARYGLTNDGRAVCMRCVPARSYTISELIEPKGPPNDSGHVPAD